MAELRISNSEFVLHLFSQSTKLHLISYHTAHRQNIISHSATAIASSYAMLAATVHIHTKWRKFAIVSSLSLNQLMDGDTKRS